MKSFPNRAVLVKALYFGKVGSEAALFKDCRAYTQRLEKNISVIVHLYDMWSLDNDNRV